MKKNNYKNTLITLLSVIFMLSFSNYECKAQSQQGGVLIKTLQKEQKEREEQKIIEKRRYQKAIESGTLAALYNFLDDYKKGPYSLDVQNRIKDFESWNKAKNKNTIESYKSYLKKSNFLSFRKEANLAIIELRSEQEWNKIKDNNNIIDLENFVAQYSKSKLYKAAKNKLHELKAIRYYKQKQYLRAYDEFKAVEPIISISKESLPIYKACKEFNDYNSLNSTATEKELITFIEKYPNGKYYNKVSNQIAISRAKSLNKFSSNLDYGKSLKYATDRETKNIVHAYIKASQKSYKSYMRQKRIQRIKSNGGYVNFGINILDFAGDIKSSSDYNRNIYTINTGLSLKVGNYKAPVQFEVGVKPGLLLIHVRDDNFDNLTRFVMPVFSRLKVNLFGLKLFPSTKLINSQIYISGLATYNAIRYKSYETEFSVGGGLGVAFKHFDWFAIYYRQGLRDNDKYRNNYSYYDKNDNKFLGTSLTYYF